MMTKMIFQETLRQPLLNRPLKARAFSFILKIETDDICLKTIFYFQVADKLQTTA